ncbi:hypothetical protein EW026_g2599 [Hermanssonia centrifuga]|uniref:MHC class I antigen n=1 Tax=Hermanssonia centrifuga TaxID=98765 RepID=A0A4S4KPS8_9APHY|nr:hypothetical protein EW026_g2599 [Hermanssonia centrifuga]
MGLSFDFFQVLVASEVTGLVTLGELAVDSIKYSCLNNEEKEQALAKWERQWYEFLSWIVAEHQSHEVSKLGDTLSQPKT